MCNFFNILPGFFVVDHTSYLREGSQFLHCSFIYIASCLYKSIHRSIRIDYTLIEVYRINTHIIKCLFLTGCFHGIDIDFISFCMTLEKRLYLLLAGMYKLILLFTDQRVI